MTAQLPKGVERFDRHGFAIFSPEIFHESERYHPEEIDERDGPDNSRSLANVQAWQTVLSDWPQTQIRGCNKLRSLLKKGVPCALRQQLWLNLLGCKQVKQTSKFNYKASVRLIRRELVDIGMSEYCLHQTTLDWTLTPEPSDDYPVPIAVIRQITVDVDRTFPSHRLFMDESLEAREGRASLFRLLAVYAFYNPQVAYCQGMSYIAGMLIMQMTNEEEAFWALVALFEKPKYLSGYFDHSLQRIQQHAVVFQKLIAHRLPRLASHLASVDLDLLMFVTPWFMCLYTSFPCWDTVLSIWDLILLDGISTIFRVALAVLRLGQDEILKMSDLCQILPMLLHPPLKLVSAKNLLPVIWKTTVDKWEIDALQAIVTEETDSKPGRKRRHRYNTDIGDTQVVEKRPRSVDTQEMETSVFQRVLNLFRPSTRQHHRRSSPRLQAARLRAAAQQHATPGTAKAAIPTRQTPFTPGSPSFLINGIKALNTAECHTDSKAPDRNNNAGLVASDVTASHCTINGTTPSSMRDASVKWRKLNEPDAFSCTSPWKESLKALTFNLPVQQGVMIFGGEYEQTKPCPTGNSSVSMSTGKTPAMTASSSQHLLSIAKQDDKPSDHISPCVLATEQSCTVTDNTSQESVPAKQPAKCNTLKGVRFSPRYSVERRTLRGISNIKPLNTPSGRRIVSKSAKVQHSFKSFHTPTPLRRSQVSRLNSPQYSSPDVELQPMNLGAHMVMGHTPPTHPPHTPHTPLYSYAAV